MDPAAGAGGAALQPPVALSSKPAKRIETRYYDRSINRS